ncbi:MAG TPA: CRTAC1 family protein [Vicinamibacterales bacterium]|nr:CRTAC1 family protein [Vicinamibacterales bacterium]
MTHVGRRLSRAVLVALVTSVAVVAGQRGPAPAAVQFENVSTAAGIDFTHVSGASPARHLYEIMSGGGLFLDYDNDGWQDALLVDGGSLVDPVVMRRARHRLFHNRGNGTFEDVTATSGLTHPQYGMGGCAADYDNDGWIDVYLTSVGTNTLFRNTGGKAFADVTRTAGVGGAPSFSSSCAWADVDRDGAVDLFVVKYVDARVDNQVFCGDTSKEFRVYCHPLNFAPLRSVLYRNNGNGTFSDASREWGVFEQRGNGLGVVVGDYDDDGWPDVFVANDTTPNFLYHNEQGKKFTEVALRAGVSVAGDGMPRAGMGTDVGDADGDGRLDVFVTNHEFEGHTLFHSLGGGLFEDATFKTGVGPATLPFVGFGTLFFDADNDGDLDLSIVNGHVMNSPGHVRPGAKEAQRRVLLRNEGGRFRDVAAASGAGFTTERVGRALAGADIDNDGDVDLLAVNNNGPADLLRNGGAPGAGAVIVRLVGTASNRSAVGARLRATVGTATQVREVKAGSSYLAQNDLRVHVGLGAAKQIDRLEIRWPNGRAPEVITGVAAGQIVTVTEGKGITARLPFGRPRE